MSDDERIERLEAVRNAAVFLLAMKDGPRDDYFRRNKEHAWDHLRRTLAELEDRP